MRNGWQGFGFRMSKVISDHMSKIQIARLSGSDRNTTTCTTNGESLMCTHSGVLFVTVLLRRPSCGACSGEEANELGLMSQELHVRGT
ncbi:hypothetical protein DVH24_006207 [Malus domestica]|uniref:Uncharacterized protein n=1 Tax=Malus domestica TaxID=3750 RepID=A0A498KN13_MALDO|nr:hypothetical protein DVH24_006207 [Malus domestica]